MKLIILLSIFYVSFSYGDGGKKHIDALYKRVQDHWKKNPGKWARSLGSSAKDASIKARGMCNYYLKELIYEPNFQQLYPMLKEDGYPKGVFNIENCAKGVFKSCMDDKKYVDLVRELKKNSLAYFNRKEKYKHLHTQTIYKYYDSMMSCRERFGKSVLEFFK